MSSGMILGTETPEQIAEWKAAEEAREAGRPKLPVDEKREPTSLRVSAREMEILRIGAVKEDKSWQGYVRSKAISHAAHSLGVELRKNIPPMFMDLDEELVAAALTMGKLKVRTSAEKKFDIIESREILRHWCGRDALYLEMRPQRNYQNIDFRHLSGITSVDFVISGANEISLEVTYSRQQFPKKPESYELSHRFNDAMKKFNDLVVAAQRDILKEKVRKELMKEGLPPAESSLSILE